MRKKILWFAFIALIVSASLFTTAYKDNSFEIVKNLDIYTSLFKELNLYYVDEIDPGKTIKTSIDKMLESLDPYTNYIPESDIEDYRFMTTGNYGGVGAVIRKNEDRVMIVDPYEGFPAQIAGLKAGDILMQIDDFDTKNKSIQDVSEKLKGQPSTSINIKVKRPNQDEIIEKTVIRKKIHVPAVPFYGMLDDKTGYLTVSNFTHKVSDEVKKALLDLKSQGAKGFVLDFRGNPGGLLNEAVEIVNLFVKKDDLIVFTKGKVAEWNKKYYAQKEPLIPNAPITILVNSSSASASEIVSGAIQDLDRGVILGIRTFGKGLVQTTRPLSYNAQMKITTAKYYIPSGRCIQALDYSNRREDGSVGKIPDSLITEFKTKNGRSVYDGGGVMPDVEIKPRTMSQITYSLIRKNLIFDFATQFEAKIDHIAEPSKFKITDDIYAEFTTFIKNKSFDYKLKSVSELEELEKVMKQEKYLNLAKTEIEALKAKLTHDKTKDLETFKDEIKELLSEEIVSRYYYQKGRMEAAVRNDPIVDSAIQILNQPNRYNKILTK